MQTKWTAKRYTLLNLGHGEPMPDGIRIRTQSKVPFTLSEFGVPKDEICCYQGVADLTMIVEAWRQIDIHEKPT